MELPDGEWKKLITRALGMVVTFVILAVAAELRRMTGNSSLEGM
jgi:hypothetical protein